MHCLSQKIILLPLPTPQKNPKAFSASVFFPLPKWSSEIKTTLASISELARGVARAIRGMQKYRILKMAAAGFKMATTDAANSSTMSRHRTGIYGTM